MLLDAYSFFLRIDSKTDQRFAGWKPLRLWGWCALLKLAVFLQVYGGRCDGCPLAAELSVFFDDSIHGILMDSHQRYGCFLKWWYPQIIHFNRVLHYKPSILGYLYFWKHPYGYRCFLWVWLSTTHGCHGCLEKLENAAGAINSLPFTRQLEENEGMSGISMSFFHQSHQGSLSLVIETLSDEWWSYIKLASKWSGHGLVIPHVQSLLGESLL